MKTYKTVYVVKIDKLNRAEYQYLMPKEFHLIKTMLNDGVVISGIYKEEVTPERYKYLFG